MSIALEVREAALDGRLPTSGLGSAALRDQPCGVQSFDSAALQPTGPQRVTARKSPQVVWVPLKLQAVVGLTLEQ